MRLPFITKSLLAASIALSATFSVTAESSYTWNPVRIGGGGATTSIQAHPRVKNLYFITTDVGTPYRWNAAEQRWEGMLYKNTAAGWDNRSAAARLAIDPGDVTGNTIYITTGGFWTVDGTVLKSVDRGNTWGDCQILLDVSPNKEQGAGQRIAVDPLNRNVVYVTTRAGKTPDSPTNGTFMSNKGGAPGSWTKVNDLCGSFLQFDAVGGTVNGVTRVIYLGCADGMYRSTDGGATFALLPDGPAKLNKASIHPRSGLLYVTSGQGLFKWNGAKWTDITPPTPGNYSAVAVNPNNQDQVVASSGSFSPYRFIHYRSKDGGKTWTQMPIDPDLSEAPWFATSLGQATSTFCWDPFNPKTVWFTDFFFASQTTDIWASPRVMWKPRAAGHEETVSTGTLLCPPSGANLLHSSMADVGGWDHTSLTTPPAVGMMKFFPWTPKREWGNLSGVAVQETNPNFIARVGRAGWSGPGYCGYSTDGGKTYTIWDSPADAAGGRIAISATSETMVWVTQQKGSYRSTDRGVTWTPITTLPNGIIIGGANIFSSGPRFPLAADKVNGSKFYVYHYGRVYVSTDEGATFAAKAHLPNSYPTNHLTLETTPGKEGDLWVGMKEGLFHSTDSGETFTRITDVKGVDFLAIGKASPANPDIPAVYVLGKVNSDVKSLHRSTDNGSTWTDLDLPEIGKTPLTMAADRRVYGRVFFGTGGNGILMGEP
jgi:hypothetical protein